MIVTLTHFDTLCVTAIDLKNSYQSKHMFVHIFTENVFLIIVLKL